MYFSWTWLIDHHNRYISVEQPMYSGYKCEKKKYKQKDLVGNQLSVSLCCRFDYRLFWMKMDTSEIPN